MYPGAEALWSQRHPRMNASPFSAAVVSEEFRLTAEHCYLPTAPWPEIEMDRIVEPAAPGETGSLPQLPERSQPPGAVGFRHIQRQIERKALLMQ